MDFYGIAQMSMNMSLAKTQSAVQLSLLKKSMDSQEASMALLLEGMPQQPVSFGHKLDVRV